MSPLLSLTTKNLWVLRVLTRDFDYDLLTSLQKNILKLAQTNWLELSMSNGQPGCERHQGLSHGCPMLEGTLVAEWTLAAATVTHFTRKKLLLDFQSVSRIAKEIVDSFFEHRWRSWHNLGSPVKKLAQLKLFEKAWAGRLREGEKAVYWYLKSFEKAKLISRKLLRKERDRERERVRVWERVDEENNVEPNEEA